MKKIVYVAGFIALFGAGMYALMNFGSTEEYRPVEPTQVIEEVKPLDHVSEAQKQLNEAKRLLDAEEAKILAEIEEKEARLEEIREVRLSFSQAPEPVQ